jgi:UV DNA damage endonuclease
MRTLNAEKKWKWQDCFAKELLEIGNFVREHNMRISMHPDHFCLINSTSEDILKKSIWELEYHADLFECMQLDSTHKFQIHVGGVYGDKAKSMQRFVDRYNNNISDRVKQHLVIENDDHLFSLNDCIWISERCHVPILFDTLHHECLNTSNETQRQAFKRAAATWEHQRDGIPMIDYSSQTTALGAKRGKHTESIDLNHFEKIICQHVMRSENEHGYIPCDIMLEIKDKEASAIACISMFQQYREKYYGSNPVKVPFSEDELEQEKKDIQDQAKISNRDEHGLKKVAKRKEAPSKKKTQKRAKLSNDSEVVITKRVTRSSVKHEK